MQVAVERRPGSQVVLTVTVEPEQVKERAEQLFQKYARRVSIPGFRPGKAPRALVEGRIDQQALMQDAIDGVIDATYKAALREQNLEPMERGEVQDLQVGEDTSVTYQVLVTVRPEVTLPPYDELHVQHTPTAVTEEQVDAEIQRLLDRGAEATPITDSGIEAGDYVTIDYTMQVDGQPYPEGDTTGYPLEVGADTFFPELNDALLGVQAGDATTVTTTYAEDYTNAELAGKTAAFAITVKTVFRRVKPALEDAWVTNVSNGALHTVEELRGHFRKQLEDLAAQMDRDHVRSELMSQLMERAEIDVPASLAEEEYEHLMEELEQELSHQHLSLEEYARRQERRVADIENEQQMLARDLVRRSLVLQAIARKEGIVVTDEDLDALVMMEAYSRGEESLDKVRRNLKAMRRELEKSGQLDRLASRLFREKILTFLETHADVQMGGAAGAAAAAPVESAAGATETPAAPAAEAPKPKRRKQGEATEAPADAPAAAEQPTRKKRAPESAG